MAAVDFQETDTAVSCALAAYCSALVLTAGTSASRQASSGGTAGTGTVSPSIAKAETNVIGAGFECVVQSGATWASGTWTVRLDVTAANTNLTWTECFICRVNSGCVSQATIGSNTAVGISLGTTGIKTTTVTGSAQTPAPGDKVYVLLAFTNSATHAASAFSFVPDQLISSPFTAGAALTRNVSDSITLGESLARVLALTRQVSDVVSVAEAISSPVALSRSVTDGVTFSDSVTGKPGIGRGVSDTLVIGENLTRALALTQQVSDSMVMTESLVRRSAWLRAMGDSIAFSDSVAGAVGGGNPPPRVYTGDLRSNYTQTYW